MYRKIICIVHATLDPLISSVFCHLSSCFIVGAVETSRSCDFIVSLSFPEKLTRFAFCETRLHNNKCDTNVVARARTHCICLVTTRSISVISGYKSYEVGNALGIRLSRKFTPSIRQWFMVSGQWSVAYNYMHLDSLERMFWSYNVISVLYGQGRI